MVRTQIQLTEQQAASLKALSSERHQPVAELIRISIDSFLQKEKGLLLESRIARAKSAAGRFASSGADVSARHDQYLAAAFGQK